MFKFGETSFFLLQKQLQHFSTKEMLDTKLEPQMSVAIGGLGTRISAVTHTCPHIVAAMISFLFKFLQHLEVMLCHI